MGKKLPIGRLTPRLPHDIIRTEGENMTAAPSGAFDESVRTIAARLGRSPSTVSREISRHSGKDEPKTTDLVRAGQCRPWA